MSRRYGLRPWDSPPTITPASRLSIGGAMRMSNPGAPATGASPFAGNDILAFPFTLETDTTFYKGFWVNGSSAGGNSEVGIYDEAFNKIVTTGSVAGSGNSAPQAAALTATTALPSGFYYAIMAHSVSTTNQIQRWSVTTFGTGLWQAAGCWRQASITLGSLPATATPADIANDGFPLFGLITRSAYDV